MGRERAVEWLLALFVWFLFLYIFFRIKCNLTPSFCQLHSILSIQNNSPFHTGQLVKRANETLERKNTLEMTFQSSVLKVCLSALSLPSYPRRPVAIIIRLPCEWGAALGFQMNYLYVNFTARIKPSDKLHLANTEELDLSQTGDYGCWMRSRVRGGKKKRKRFFLFHTIVTWKEYDFISCCLVWITNGLFRSFCVKLWPSHLSPRRRIPNV